MTNIKVTQVERTHQCCLRDLNVGNWFYDEHENLCVVVKKGTVKTDVLYVKDCAIQIRASSAVALSIDEIEFMVKA